MFGPSVAHHAWFLTPDQGRSEVRTKVEQELSAFLGAGALSFEPSGAPIFMLNTGALYKSFSYSHTQGAALLVIGAEPNSCLGVDIEARGRRFKNPKKIAARLGLEDFGDAALLEAWVRIEAISKAHRCSLWASISSSPDLSIAQVSYQNGYVIGLATGLKDRDERS